MPGSRSTASSSRSPSRPNSLYKAEVWSSSHGNSHHGDEDESGALSVPVETLVEHLLAARRALGTINQVLRGNELATEARKLHTEAVVLAAQTAFLRRGIREQVNVLLQVRRGLSRAYDAGRRDFRTLIRTLDAANGQLEHTMDILRATTVAAVFRPAGEEPRNLLDFIDEAGMEALRDAIKQSIAELQAAQTSFDGDLLRFDNDLRSLNKAMSAAPSLPPPLLPDPDIPEDERLDPVNAVTAAVPHLLSSLTKRSHTMAENLSSLTRHFDLCVTAVRTTEGGPALARWKAANSREAGGNSSSSGGGGDQGAEPVSISGVIAEQEAASGRDGVSDLEPLSARERAEMIQVVLQDAAEVDDVVAEIAAELHEADAEFAAVRAHADQAQAAYAATAAALRVLDDIGTRLPGYAAAETEFTERWANERAVVADRLADMDDLRAFYEGYANAYDTLILEAERRRTVEARIQTVWRKARDAVERLVDADRAERESFRQEVGEFLPTDLWLDMDRPPRGTELFAVAPESAQQPPPRPPSSSSAAAQPDPQNRKSHKNTLKDAAQSEGGADSILYEAGNDPSSSRGAGGSSTRTVVGR